MTHKLAKKPKNVVRKLAIHCTSFKDPESSVFYEWPGRDGSLCLVNSSKGSHGKQLKQVRCQPQHHPVGSVCAFALSPPKGPRERCRDEQTAWAVVYKFRLFPEPVLQPERNGGGQVLRT